MEKVNGNTFDLTTVGNENNLSLMGQIYSPIFHESALKTHKFIIDKMCAQVGDELVNLGYDCYFFEDQTYDGKFPKSNLF
jgi:hypothetical protein